MFVVHNSVQQQHQDVVLRLQAEGMAQQLNLRITEIENQLSTMSNSVQLAQIVSDNVASTRAQEESNMLRLIPHAIRARIFGIREAEVQRDAVPPFSFTSLDLVNKVEAGNKVHPEAINANGRWIISIATPIKIPSDDTVRGTLFVYLEMNSLVSALQSNLNGELKVLQAVGNASPTEILVTGESPGQDAASMTVPLSNPNWSITFTPAISGHEEIGSIVMVILPSLIMLLIGVAAVAFGQKQIVTKLSQDLAHFDHQISSVAAGSFEPSQKYQLDGFIDVDSNLARLGSKPASTEPPPQLDIKSVTPKPTAASEEIVDIEMTDDESFDNLLEDFEDLEEPAEEIADVTDEGNADIDASIFRAYDIRGIINDTLTPEAIQLIGLAIGTEAEAQGEQTILVGADGRVSSPDVMDALIAGLIASGRDVISIGQVPTPVLYFATHNSDTTSGVMVTGSHNPPEYNGFKIVIGGRTLIEEDIQGLYKRIQSDDFSSGEGELTEINITEDYIDAIADDVVVAQPLKVVLDCGNGIAGEIAPELFSALGCDVVPLYCDVDGNFPNHPPDPTRPENLEDLVLTVKSQEADIGLAFDGDGDRLVAVTSDGDIVWPDRLMMMFAKDVVSRNPGSDVVYDVKCTRHLNSVISGFGGRPVLCRTGHSYMKAKMVETGAVLGGEMSGHICFSERWFGFDDGIYSGARLVEIVGSTAEGLAELLSEFPVSIATPEIQIPVDDASKFEIMEILGSGGDFGDATLTTIDGIRADYTDGWGLIRASNTSPILTLRFEADTDEAIEKIKRIFREQLQSVREDLDFS